MGKIILFVMFVFPFPQPQQEVALPYKSLETCIQAKAALDYIAVPSLRVEHTSVCMTEEAFLKRDKNGPKVYSARLS